MTVNETGNITALYFDWLYDQLVSVRDLGSPESYIIVCSLMYGVAFQPLVPNDDNRAADGKELRDEFIATLSSMDVEDFAKLYGIGEATILEVLAGLARRANFIAEIGIQQWFAKFLENLGLARHNDRDYQVKDGPRINRVLRNFNSRRYSPTGKGSLFPLKHAQEDQRGVEIWYQMAAFMTENKMY